MLKKIIVLLIISFVIIGAVLTVYTESKKQNIIEFEELFTNTSSMSTSVEARFIDIDFVKKTDLKRQDRINENGYYIFVYIVNNTNVKIDSDIIFNIDIKYKNSYILKNGICNYKVADDFPIYKGSPAIILIKTSEEVYQKYKEANPFSEEILTKINSLEYKEDIRWLKGWKKGSDSY